MKAILKMLLAVIACLIVFDGSQARAATEVPAEWLGVWEIDIAVYDCDTNDLIFQSAELDTLCPGDLFEAPEDEEFTLTCSTSADANSFSDHCEGESEAFPGCTATFTYDATGTRTGETYTATTTTTISYVGVCLGLEGSCMRTEITGTRIAGVPNPCGSTPNLEQSWGAVKSSYR